MGDDDPEPLDPRIQHELERLNKASLLINRLENDLDEARAKFRNLLTESTHQLESLCKKLGGCIDKAKPYYDCRLKAKEMHVHVQQAATKYERAMSMQTAAREMVELAEQGYESKKPTFDTAWQEMLNHATMKVMDAENERMLSEADHQRTAQEYAEVQEQVNIQYKENKRSIVKSKSYYEKKASFHMGLENQKQCIEKLQADIESAKKLYAKALSNLEGISEEIHMKRKESAETLKLGEREAGVGSESPVPPPQDEKPNTKAFNNNDTQETEIIISYPPAVPNSRDSRVLDERRKTIGLNTPDEPIDLSGIKIDVVASPTSAPAIVVDGVDTNDSLPNQRATVTNQITDKLDSANQQPDDVTSTNQILHNGLSSNQMEQLTEKTISNNQNSAASSVSSSPVTLRHKRGLSGSIKLSAKQLLHETSSIDSDSGSVSSFVGLDDYGVASAMNEEYFRRSFDEELRKTTHEDYSKLPNSLAEFQKPYEITRKSVTSFPPLDEADLKLDQVLKLLESTDDESIV